MVKPNLEGSSKREKILAGASLLFGNRSMEFTDFLEKVPSIEEFMKIEEREEADIQGVIFDIDGTLVPPYGEVPENVIALLKSYKNAGKKVAVYTNSGDSERLNSFRDNDIEVIQTSHGKPSNAGFIEACEQIGINPKNTAMIGNFAVTDMPRSRVKEGFTVGDVFYRDIGEQALFPINILVESIPPSKDVMEDTTKYARAMSFHILNLIAGKVVKLRNPYIVERQPLNNSVILGLVESVKTLCR